MYFHNTHIVYNGKGNDGTADALATLIDVSFAELWY